MLFYSTGGSDWTDTSLWLTNNATCGWTGIDCNADDRVTGINLKKNSLSGSLPSELSTLSALQSLTLFRNSLTGTIPTKLFTVSDLLKRFY